MMTLSEKLLSYHLNSLDEGDRSEVEELLLDSPAAVMEFIALKREREAPELAAPARGPHAPAGPSRADPSPALKARLREAVARDYAAARPRFGRSGARLAVAAAAVIALAVLWAQLSHRVPAPREPLPATAVDGAEPSLGVL